MSVDDDFTDKPRGNIFSAAWKGRIGICDLVESKAFFHSSESQSEGIIVLGNFQIEFFKVFRRSGYSRRIENFDGGNVDALGEAFPYADIAAVSAAEIFRLITRKICFFVEDRGCGRNHIFFECGRIDEKRFYEGTRQSFYFSDRGVIGFESVSLVVENGINFIRFARGGE